jgi:alpha-amylase/alpha-mannosidase (GH57 family)
VGVMWWVFHVLGVRGGSAGLQFNGRHVVSIHWVRTDVHKWRSSPRWASRLNLVATSRGLLFIASRVVSILSLCICGMKLKAYTGPLVRSYRNVTLWPGSTKKQWSFFTATQAQEHRFWSVVRQLIFLAWHIRTRGMVWRVNCTMHTPN